METNKKRELDPVASLPPSGGNGCGSPNNAPASANTEDMDAKKLRRIMASRQYSRRYRMKQLQYIIQLETEVKALQGEVMINSPRINYVDHHNSMLRAENCLMKQKLSAYTGELLFKEAQCEELKKERDFWKGVFLAVQQPQCEEVNLITNADIYQQPLIDMSLSHPIAGFNTSAIPNCSTIQDQQSICHI